MRGSRQHDRRSLADHPGVYRKSFLSFLRFLSLDNNEKVYHCPYTIHLRFQTARLDGTRSGSDTRSLCILEPELKWVDRFGYHSCLEFLN